MFSITTLLFQSSVECSKIKVCIMLVLKLVQNHKIIILKLNPI